MQKKMADAQIDVYVKLPTGRNAVYYVSPADTIHTICLKIAEEEKVKETQVRLKYQGKILEKTNSMSYLGVRPETILKAEILVPRPVTLTMSLPKGLGETEITATSLDTVDDIIDRVADIIKENRLLVVLKYNGRALRGHTLLEAGLVDGSALQVEIKEPAQQTTTCGASVLDDEHTLDDSKKQAILESFVTDGKPVEVVFSFDATGSMYSVLQTVQENLKDCCTRLIQDIPNIRIGLMAHGDYCDAQSSYVIRIMDLSSDTQAILDFVSKTPRSGGCGPAACYEWVLRKAQGLDWSEDSAKALVVIGDEKPHHKGYTDAKVFWRDELNVLTGMGVKVYGVRALNAMGSEPFYEEIAEVSGGQYLKLTHFSVITDMFLAVCYRESQENDSEALEAFAKEVEQAGRMTEERRHMFKQLEKNSCSENSQLQNEATAGQNSARQERYVGEVWWDPALGASGFSRNYSSDLVEVLEKPNYHYDEDGDTWIPYSVYERPNTHSTGAITVSTAVASTRNGISCSRKRKSARFTSRHKCSIM